MSDNTPPLFSDSDLENEGESLSSSVLQPLDNHPDRLSTSTVLDHSSQLLEEIVIDATPPIAKREQSKRALKDSDTPDTVKKGKYLLRNRKKHQRFTMEENRTPPYKAPSLRNITTRSTKKITACPPSHCPSSGPLRLYSTSGPAIPVSRAQIPLGQYLT